MTILITGGAGFIGSAVVRQAISRGYSVVNVDALTYAANLQNLSGIADHPNYTFENVDILNRVDLDRIFAKYSPTCVIHLAAESHVDKSIDGPRTFIETNILGTFNLLEAARVYWNAEGNFASFRFLHVSTDEVFGSLPNIASERFTERTPYDPRSPYSASKASSDHLVSSWYHTYGLPIIVTNCSNNYGPYQYPEKLIPLMVLNALAKKPLGIYGDGTNIRDWLFVEDHAEALLLISEKSAIGESYNIGGENERTNLELVKMLCDILDYMRPLSTGSYQDLITFTTDRPGHDARYAIDPSHIQAELGWYPSTTLEQGLEKTIEWYLNNENWWVPVYNQINFGKPLYKL